MSAFDVIPAERLEQSRLWTERVWGNREGYFSWALGVGGHFNGAGRYDFDKWLERDGGRWPDDRDRFLDEALDKAGECDVYVAPYLRSSPSRKKGTALPSVWLYADLDEIPEGQIRTPDGVLVLGPGGLLVGSGEGRHVYPRLPEELEPSELERLNQRLARALDADSGWSETKVLRLPGTWNHKGRARGGKSTPVEILDFRPAVKDWSAEELSELLPVGSSDVTVANGDGPPIEPAMPEDVPAQLLARRDEEPSGDRSKQTLLFVAACVDAGLDDAAVMALALEHRPTREKYGSDDPDSDRRSTEIGRALRKVRSNRREPLPTVTTVGGFQGAPGVGGGTNSRTVATVREDGTTTPLPTGHVGGATEQSSDPATVPDSETVEDTFVDPTVTLSEFVAAVDESASEPLFVCDQGNAFLRGSLGLLVAKTGDGKTTLAVAFTLHASAGLDFAGFRFPRPLRVLVIQNEGPREAFRQKLEAAAEHWSHAIESVRIWDEPDSWGSVKVSVPEARSRLRRVLELHDVDIVIVDTLTRYGVRGNGTPEETREFIGWLTETGLGRDRGFLLLHHPITRPDASLDLIERIAGAWAPHADVVLYLEKLADKRARLSSAKLRWAREDRPAVLLGFDPESSAFTFLGEQSEVERDYLAEMKALLGDGGWRTVREIASTEEGGIGADYNLVKAHLDDHPDEFESRTGDAAKALGRKPTATLWQLRQREDDEDPAETEVDPARVIGSCDCGRPIVRGTGNTATKCGTCAKADLRYSDGGVS